MSMTFTTMGDVLDELMALNNLPITTDNNDDDNVNNSSSMAQLNNIENIMYGITVESKYPVRDTIETFKNALLNTIDELKDTIQFLKNELVEKNLLIRALTFRDASRGEFIENLTVISESVDTISQVDFTHDSEYRNRSVNIINEQRKIVDYDITIDSNDSLINNYDTSTPSKTCNYDGRLDECTTDEETDATTENGDVNYDDLFTWARHSSRVASNIMNRMGYKGKGLGKREDGITAPITINESRVLGGEKSGIEKEKRKVVYIASDSMLNRLDEKRLSKMYDVRIACHGGCTIKCLYTHLTPMFQLKPDYIILNIGTNDCSSKTSDQVLNELRKLYEFIKFVLPSAEVTISLPTVRSDNMRANQIIKNLNTKLKRLQYQILDNSNINENHLGKKGLHFNDHGVKRMAKNIISLVRRW